MSSNPSSKRGEEEAELTEKSTWWSVDPGGSSGIGSTTMIHEAEGEDDDVCGDTEAPRSDPVVEAMKMTAMILLDTGER